jgi:hypothetical protein
MRVIIHGGMFKTGTTSLQQSMYNNRISLERKGIVYPETESRQHSVLLNVRDPRWSPEKLRNLALVSDSTKASVLFLSGESATTLSQSQFNRLTACFEGWPVEYIFCIRHWSTYLPSRWAQNCVRRDSQTFGEYLVHSLDPATEHIDTRFDLILSRAVASGAEKVHAVSWDLAMAKDNSSIPEVLRAAALDDSIIQQITSGSERLNVTSGLMNVELCRILNGIIANTLGLEQDELFLAYSEHRECGRFFDLIRITRSLPPAIHGDLALLLEKTGVKRVDLPDFHDLGVLLAEQHYSRFTNVSGPRIFGEAEEADHTFDFVPLPWQNILPLAQSDELDRWITDHFPSRK